MTVSIAVAITATLSICGAIISAMLMLGTALGGNLKERVYRWFFITLLFSMVGCCAETVSVLPIGTSGHSAYVALEIIDFLSYAFGNAAGIAFSVYIYEYMSVKKQVSRIPFILITICLSANIVLIGLGQTSGYFTLLDKDDLYVPKGFTLFAQILPTIVFVALIVTTLYYIKILRMREWISLLFYVVLPLLCYMVEYVFLDYPLWISYFGTAVALFLVYINIQVELKKTLNRRDAELAESRIDIMLTQIQPHFLYNSLTAIGKLCDMDPQKAKNAVNDFADYLRGNLESLGTRKQIYFSDELEHVETYLALEQLRFGERLKTHFDISVEDFVLPPLTVQPLVENAVQHGIMQKEEGGTVSIKTEQTDTAIRIIISDDGIGFDSTNRSNDGRTHIGVENVSGRLSAMCGATLKIDSDIGRGTTAIITIPNNNSMEDSR